MHSAPLVRTASFAATAVLILLLLGSTATKAQTPQVAAAPMRVAAPRGSVTLDPETQEELAARGIVEGTASPQTLPENFRRFAPVSKGQIGDLQTLTLRFAASAKLLTIKSTADFRVEQGGSCVEGFSYTANSTCTLLVRSTPQGPGRRLGKLEITNSVDATPLNVGLGGYGYVPTISFTPSLISTVPGTYPGNRGLLSGATNLAVDGGDSLYMADTGNNVVRYVDSSGTLSSIAPASYGVQDPVGVTVDNSGTVYFSQDSPAAVQAFYLFNQFAYYSAGTTSCALGSTCSLNGSLMDVNGAMATDPAGNVFLGSFFAAAKLVPAAAFTDNYVSLFNPYSFNETEDSSPQPLAVDADDSIYAYQNYDGICFISFETYYQATGLTYGTTAVAGGRTCGFSGDGGQARGAEVGTSVGQMAFDIAGNFYFSDTSNQRVRRIDASTGIITTIAGNGSVGYAGDGGPATSASLNNPTGVAVDSQGQVYIISSATTSGQVVRKVGVVGALNLGSLAVGTASTAQTVQLANTGNSELDFTHVGFSSGNTTDFVIDPNTTSCNFTVALAAGRSCRIGFIFTPSATGARSAVLSITDDTIAGLNTIQLSGTGTTSATLTPASFSFASTTVGSSSTSQTATLTNTGKAAMTISSIVISGTGATSYSDTTTCGTTLAAAASCTIAVTFKPATTGTLTATLTVSDNALTGHQTVSLTGVGVAAAAKPVPAPTSLTFGSQTVGTTSAAQTINLSNTGTAALGVTSIKMAGTDPGDYTVSNNCGTSVAAGGSCTISVSFKPTAAGTRTASVSVVASTGTLTASVTGTATAAITKAVLASASNPSVARALAFTVTVDSPAGPTGRVQLKEGLSVWAEGSLSGGVAVFQVGEMSAGVHMLNAVYFGDANNLGSTSPELRQIVQP